MTQFTKTSPSHVRTSQTHTSVRRLPKNVKRFQRNQKNFLVTTDAHANVVRKGVERLLKYAIVGFIYWSFIFAADQNGIGAGIMFICELITIFAMVLIGSDKNLKGEKL